MNAQLTYFLILACSLIGPLALSFDKRVAFFRQWKYALPAMILPAVFYIAWDSLFTRSGVWSFDPDRVISLRIFHLPIEEILFFFVVPYCCLFIYACTNAYLPPLKNKKATRSFHWALIAVFFAIGIFYNQRAYTFFTFIFTGSLFAITALSKYGDILRSAAFWFSYALILIPFLVVNGLLTAIPVVLYNDAENSGLRIGSIPAEDLFYGLLLFAMNVVCFEFLKQKDLRDGNSKAS